MCRSYDWNKAVIVKQLSHPYGELWKAGVSFVCLFFFFFLFAVYSGVPWQHTAASVPRHVPPHGGRRRDVHDRHAQRVQPPSLRAQKI